MATKFGTKLAITRIT